MDWTEFAIPLTSIQFYGLIFLLGSFTVASLSDLRRMAAQQDFAEVWAAFAGIMLLYDAYLTLTTANLLLPIAVKWLIILIFLITTTSNKINIGISLMDIAAVTALLSTINPIYLITALILLLLLGELMRPLLKPFGEIGAYPYLPVVLATTLIIILIHVTGVIQINPTITPQ